nr:IQ and ubiquitin-like domain-containing protein [Penaeus vannamei]
MTMSASSVAGEYLCLWIFVVSTIDFHWSQVMNTTECTSQGHMTMGVFLLINISGSITYLLQLPHMIEGSIGHSRCESKYAEDVECVVEVQRRVRGWLARKRVRRLKQERRQLEKSTSESTSVSPHQVDSANSVSDNSVSTSSSHKRWRGAVPMAELYSRLEGWRRRQVAQITATLTGQDRRRALVALLDKETELLRSLEAHRAVRSARRRNAAIALFLQEVSRAQVWKVGSHAAGVEVETPETEPVRTLASLASALQKDASTEVRGQQFNSVFSTVERFRPSHGDPDETSRTARELGALARRGLHLLARGTTDSRLRGLRKRLHSLIITYLQQVQTRSSVPMQPRLVRAAGGKPLLVPTTST